VIFASFDLFALLWPLGLISAGLAIIYFVIRGRR
jgi:hypothetical protein